jgi:hypothetical protein
LSAFLQAFLNVFHNMAVTSADFAAKARAQENQHLRNNLPEGLRIVLDQKEGRAAAKVTGFFKSIQNRLAGGMKLTSSPNPHTKILEWRVESVFPETAAGT